MEAFVLKIKQRKAFTSLYMVVFTGICLFQLHVHRVVITQSQNWWRTIGNSANNNDFLGTTNAVDLIFKSNNNEQFLNTFNHSLNLKIVPSPN